MMKIPCLPGHHKFEKPPRGHRAFGIGGYMKTGVLWVCEHCGAERRRDELRL